MKALHGQCQMVDSTTTIATNSSLESVENKLEYKQIEILVNGKKVRAHFPNVDVDNNIMTLVKDMMILSYLNNTNEINKNASFVEKE